ncbi:MAG: hypothetical protein PHO70_03755 [Candidatus Omnitrophica bacterium]|nr:hypothetical protein [Candidatus Omnitrophota bacterium]
MGRFISTLGVLFVLSCMFNCSAYSQEVLVVPNSAVSMQKAATKSVDVNKDGKPDIVYHSSDGKKIDKIEADTNYDGKVDVVVNVFEGKFMSADVDENHDGKMDKKITKESEYVQWLNKNNSDFSDSLYRPNWEFGMVTF